MCVNRSKLQSTGITMSRTDAGINQHRAARNCDRNWVETEIKYRVWNDSLAASRETGSFNGSMQRHPGRELKQDPKQLGCVLRAGGSVNSFWWKKTKALGTTVSFWWAEISPVLSMLMSKKENTGIYFSLKIDCLLRSKVFFTFKPHLCSSFCIKNPMLHCQVWL